MSSDARDKSRDLKKTAIERSLIDVDQTMNEATEALALEKNDEAVRLYKQLLSSLEDRYPGNMEKIPADVLIRRYKILNGLSKAFSSGGHLNQAIQNALEASALTQGPLSDFTELHIQSSVDLAGYYIKSGDVQSARALITKATSVEKGDDPQLWQALISLGTGKLFNALGKLDVAPRVIQSGIDALATPEEPEKILLKADLYLALGDVYMKLEHRDEALQSWKEAIVLLNDRGKKAFLKYEYFSALSYFAKARPIFQFLGREPDVIQIRADSEILLAKIMDIRGRWDDAYKLFSGVVELFHGTGFEDSRLFILAHAGVGNYFIQQKQYDRAEAELKKSTAAAKQFRDRLGFCQANYYLGVAFSKRGSDEQGIELFKRSLEHLKKIESSYEVLQTIALINNQLGFIEMKNRRREEAKEYFNLSVETMKDAPFDLSLGEAYRFLGELHSENRQYTQAERYLKKALEIFEKNGAMFELSRLYRSLGSNLLNMGDIDKAVFFFDECIGLQEKLGVESELPMAYSNRAKISVMKEEYAEAEAYFTKDFNIAKKSDNKHSLAFSYYQLGRIRRILTRTHSAEDFLRRSLDLFTSVNNKTMIGGVLLELALCASARKDIKGATDYCARAQTMYEHNRNSLEMARLLLTRGIVLRDAKRKQMAQRCFEDCLRLHEKLNITTIDLAEAYYEFALFWQDQGDRKEASQQLSLAIETTEKLGLGKKMSNYAVLLNDIDPEAAAKAQLSRFMGKATVEQISKRKRSDDLTVERRNLTLLFTDIRGFTTISETLDLGILTQFLNDFYSNVTQVIIKNRGQINKFIGDAVMAVFNIDGTLEDHQVWAVRAAMDLMRTIAEVNLIRQKRGEVNIDIGTGVNTGEVLLGSFGSSMRQDYTAIGDNVNIAARLQAQAGPGEVVISDAVYEYVKDIVEVDDMGEKPLKGKGQPLHLWKVLKIKE